MSKARIKEVFTRQITAVANGFFRLFIQKAILIRNSQIEYGSLCVSTCVTQLR